MTAQPGLGIGARLESARTRARLTVIQAAEMLHVDARVIEALEAERFEELGASVFVRGHIRHYAELVREQPEALQSLYAASAHAAQAPDLTQVPKREVSIEASNALLVPAVMVVAAVAVIGTVWWVAGTLEATSHAHRASATPMVRLARAIPIPAAAAAARAVASSPGKSGQSPAPTGGFPGDVGAASVGASLPQGVAPSGEVARTGGSSPPGAARRGATATAGAGVASQGSMAKAGGRAATQGARAEAGAGAAAQGGTPEALTLRFAQDSWTEVYDAQGRRLFYDIGLAHSARTVRGTPPLRVVLGNPAGVSLRLDGRPVAIPNGAERDVVVKFRIARSGRAMPSRLAAAAVRSTSGSGGRAP